MMLTLKISSVCIISVNYKVNIEAIKISTIIWSTLIFSIRIDGVYLTTKENRFVECVEL